MHMPSIMLVDKFTTGRQQFKDACRIGRHATAAKSNTENIVKRLRRQDPH